MQESAAMHAIPKTVVFILSHNYSGSTWLSLMLGSHSQAFYLGELNKLYSKKDFRPCALCTSQGRECPYLHDVRRIHPTEVHGFLLDRVGKPMLVDNSKRVKWNARVLNDYSYQHKYVHLIKDPRAIYYSLHIRARADEFDKWIDRNAEISTFLAENNLDAYRVSYNELAENTEEALTRLNTWLGLLYEPEQQEYWRFEHHGPGENGATSAFLQNSRASDQNFYSAHRQTAFVDRRWQEHLDAATLRAITENDEVQNVLAALRMELNETGLRRANR